MQFVRLTVPQELYNQLGLQPNKTLVFRSSKELGEPNSQDINVNAPQSSQATSRSVKPTLPLPRINDSSVDVENNSSTELVPTVEEYNGTPVNVLVNAGDLIKGKNPGSRRVTYPRKCPNCGHMSNCYSSFFKHRRKSCPARLVSSNKPASETNKRIKNVAYVRYCEDDDYSDSFDDLDDEELEAMNTFMNQPSTDTKNDEEFETVGGDMTCASTSSGNAEQEDLACDAVQILTETGNDAHFGGDEVQLQTETGNNEQEVVLGGNVADVDKAVEGEIGSHPKGICRRICMSCCHSYCSKYAFKKHLKKCDEFRRRGRIPKRDPTVPLSATIRPKPDDELVNEMSTEEKPVQWFPVATKISATPSKNLKYFVVKKSSS